MLIIGGPNGSKNNNNEADNYVKEWEKSTEAVDKFDNMLIDLRKYGFSFLTGLIAAGSLLGLAAGTDPAGVLQVAEFVKIQIAVIIVTMILVIALYWLDIYYQNVLTGAIIRSEFLGIYRIRKVELSTVISSFYLNSRLGGVLRFIYGAFLFGLLILGLFVLNIKPHDPQEIYSIPLLWILFISFSVCVSLKVLALVMLYDRPRGIKYKKIAETFFDPDKRDLNRADQVEKCILKFISQKNTTMSKVCSDFLDLIPDDKLVTRDWWGKWKYY